MHDPQAGSRLDLSGPSFLTVPVVGHSLQMSRGLTLECGGERAWLRGGPRTLQLDGTGVAALTSARALAGVSFLGISGKAGFLLDAPAGHAVTGDSFVEALIEPADFLKIRLRAAAERVTGAPWSREAYEQVLHILMLLVGEGHLDAAGLEAFLAARGLRNSVAVRYAFYYANVHVTIEDMRTVFLRAMNRFTAALGIVGSINAEEPTWHEPLRAPWEIRHSSPATQALYDAYVDCLLACSSTLDLLYRLLVQVATEPLGDPAGPGRLELPFPRPGRPLPILPKAVRTKPNDLDPTAAPYALSNLVPGMFFGLKGWRNELTHNLGPAAFELPVYIGGGGTPVNGCDIQYTQFMAPDLDTAGDLASHAWVPRLYKQRRDALDQLHGWLEQTALAATQTFAWLARRLDHRARGHPCSPSG